MYVLRAFLPDHTPVPSERCQFSRLPIRIGRNPLNDFTPQHPTISAFHARIEDRDGAVCIRDVGSTNGVFVPPPAGGTPTRIELGASVDLSTAGSRFFLSGCVDVRLETVDEDAPLRQSQKAGSVLGNLEILSKSASQSAARKSGTSDDALVHSESIDPRSESASGAAPPGAVESSSGPPSSDLPGALPPLPGAPEANTPCGANRPELPADEPPRTQFLKVSLDYMALQGLRELAGSLVPGRPIETTGEVARFITKLHDTVDVFCRCFIPLRDGYAQFVSSFDLAAQRSLNRSPAALALEAASDPEAVAVALLDPSDLSLDAPQAVEGIFADLMLHHLALLDSVMEGVRALLEELSPENIEAALAERGPKGLFDAKYRARWAEFCRRFERFSDERQASSVIFGQDFAEAYRQYRRRKSKEPQGLRTDPP